jgi:hypothetical protein
MSAPQCHTFSYPEFLILEPLAKVGHLSKDFSLWSK